MIYQASYQFGKRLFLFLQTPTLEAIFMLKNNLPIALTAITLFLAPNLHNHSFSYLYFIATLSILLSIILFKLTAAYNAIIKFPSNNYFLLCIGFIAWALLSGFWSPTPSDSFYSAVILLTLPLSLLIGFWSTTKQQQYFYIALAVFILITLAKAYYQRFIIIPHQPAAGFFSNKNTNASFISMVLLPICAQFLSTKINKYTQNLYGVLLFIGSFIIALTLSRGAVLGFTIGLSLLLLHTLYHKRPFIPFIKLISYQNYEK